jgi:hypothetical protein
MAVTLGKDVVITGILNARSVSVTNSGNEVDVTKFGDTRRKMVKALIEQTVEVECVDEPGVEAGDTFTLAGSATGNVKYVVTNVTTADPIDGIQTFTVSATRYKSQT